MKMIVMLSFPRRIGLMLGTTVLLLLSACGVGPSVGSGKPDGELTIVASFYPFQFIAERVAGSHAAVQNLVQPGAEPHDLELSPKQTASLSTADLVIYQKSFQATVDEAVAQSGQDNSLDTTSVVALREVSTAKHEHDHEGDHDHDHGAFDPHVWLDPNNVATIADAVASRLAEIDPDHAADYAKNTEALKLELTDLDQSFATGLKSCARSEFITTHAAFGYLAERYHLEEIPISGLSPDAEPSPARIADIQREATEHQITTIFYETLVSPDVAKAIAGDLGLATDVLDPVEGITDASRGKDYLSVMAANLVALKAANGCDG